MTQGMVIPHNTDSHMGSTINGNFSIRAEIEMYYGLSTNSNLRGQNICMPYPSFLQWAEKFKVDMIGTYETTEEVITADLESPHLLVK